MTNLYKELKTALLQAVTASGVTTPSKIKGGEPGSTQDTDSGEVWCWVSDSSSSNQAITSNRFETSLTLNTLIFLSANSDSQLDDDLDTAISTLKTYIFGDLNLNQKVNFRRYSVIKNPEYGGRKRLGSAIIMITIEVLEDSFPLLTTNELERLSVSASYDGTETLEYQEGDYDEDSES